MRKPLLFVIHLIVSALIFFAPQTLFAEVWSGSTLWKIEKDTDAGKIGAKKITNYVFGTVHLPDARVSQFPENLDASLNQVHTIVLEVILNQQAMQEMAGRTHMNSGKTIESLLTSADVLKLKQTLNKRMISYDAIKSFKPWLIASQLMLPSNYGKKITPSIELQLEAIADSRNIQLGQLETVDEQLDLFDKLASRDQVDMLLSTLDMFDQVDDLTESLMQAYLQGDLIKLFEMNDKLNADEKNPHLRELMVELIQHRNQRMFQRMQKYIMKGDAMIAVGALHLPGDAGILNLLHQAGWKLTPVTMKWQ